MYVVCHDNERVQVILTQLTSSSLNHAGDTFCQAPF